MIWIHFIYGKCRFGWLVLHLTLSRDAFCIKEEIISSNLLNGTSYYCFMAAHGTKTGVTPRVMSPKTENSAFSLKKPAMALHCLQSKVQTPFLASTLLHGLSPWGNPSQPLLPCIFAQPPCGGSLWRGHFGLADSSGRGAEASLEKVPCPQDVGERGQKARIEADPWKTGEQGAGLSPVIHPEMKWTVSGAGMRTASPGGARLCNHGSWIGPETVAICGCVLGSLQECSHFMSSCQWKP